VTATPSHNVFLLYFRHLDDFFTTVSEMEDNVFVWQSTIETTVPLCLLEGSAYDILINTGMESGQSFSRQRKTHSQSLPLGCPDDSVKFARESIRST
jgi:hypothetical protein